MAYKPVFNQDIPLGNQLFRHLNLLIDHLKRTGITEPLITDCSR